MDDDTMMSLCILLRYTQQHGSVPGTIASLFHVIKLQLLDVDSIQLAG